MAGSKPATVQENPSLGAVEDPAALSEVPTAGAVDRVVGADVAHTGPISDCEPYRALILIEEKEGVRWLENARQSTANLGDARVGSGTKCS